MKHITNYNEWTNEDLETMIKGIYPSGTIIRDVMIGDNVITIDWNIHTLQIRSCNRDEDVELLIEFENKYYTLLWANYEINPPTIDFAKIVSSSISEEWEKLKHIIYD